VDEDTGFGGEYLGCSRRGAVGESDGLTYRRDAGEDRGAEGGYARMQARRTAKMLITLARLVRKLAK
jgi:hypothetical protein